jgi:hypothetical protein
MGPAGAVKIDGHRRMFFLAKRLKSIIIHIMRRRNRIAILVMIMALMGQAVFPGMILCRGEEGHFAVETTFDGCCSSFALAPFQSPLALSELESAAHRGCGPCTDTLISANPFRMPTDGQRSSIGPALVVTIPPIGNAGQLNKIFISLVDPTEHGLIPIKTTLLLL